MNMIFWLLFPVFWFVKHNDWSWWFAIIASLLHPISSSLNFSLMGGVGKRSKELNLDVRNISAGVMGMLWYYKLVLRITLFQTTSTSTSFLPSFLPSIFCAAHLPSKPPVQHPWEVYCYDWCVLGRYQTGKVIKLADTFLPTNNPKIELTLNLKGSCKR
jgi:hypothetical protein